MDNEEILAAELLVENTEPVGQEPDAAQPEEKKKKKKITKRKLLEYVFVFAMLLLPIIQFCIFYIWINANSVIMAFREFDGYAENGGELFKWSLYNFQRFFNEWKNPTSVVVGALKNTFKYFAAGLIMVPVTFFVAYFLYKKLWGYKFFRVIFFLPSIISAVLFVTVYKKLIDYGGPLDMFLSLFGTRIPPLLTDDKTATATIIAYTVWTGFGINMILYQSAMSRIPKEVMEAAQLDGVPWYRELGQIILPMVWPTVATTLILLITSMFNSTGPILLFAGSGVEIDNPAVTTISFWLYRQTQKAADLNYPAAIGMFFTIVSVPVVFIVRWIFNKIDPKVTY